MNLGSSFDGYRRADSRFLIPLPFTSCASNFLRLSAVDLDPFISQKILIAHHSACLVEGIIGFVFQPGDENDLSAHQTGR